MEGKNYLKYSYTACHKRVYVTEDDYVPFSYILGRSLNKDDGTSSLAKIATDVERCESGIAIVEGADRTGSSSGASHPGDKEGEKSGTKRVTRSKGQGMH